MPVRRRTREKIVKWNQMTALRFPSAGGLTSDIPGLPLGYTAVGTLSFGNTEPLGYRVVGLWICGNIELWDYGSVVI